MFETGHFSDEDRRRLTGLGAAGVIAKPFDPAGPAAVVVRGLGWAP